MKKLIFILRRSKTPPLRAGMKAALVFRPWEPRTLARVGFIIIIVIFGLIQATLLNYFSIFNVKPDLLLISVVISALFFKVPLALSFSILSGLLKDALSTNTFGMNTLLFFLWSFFIIQLSRKITLEGNYISTALIFVVSALNNIIVRVALLFFGNFIPWGIFLRITFIESLYTALIFPLILKAAFPLLLNEAPQDGLI